MDERLARFYGSVVGPYWAPERTLVETGYRTVPFPFEELEAPAFEMAHEWRLPELLAYLRTWSATSAFVKARGFDPVTALAEELGARVGRRRPSPASALAPQPPHRQAPPTRLNFGLEVRRLSRRPSMPTLIPAPTIIHAAGNKPKRIEEYAGRVTTAQADVSVARMVSPEGWAEPGQRPDFQEITLVLRGTLRVEHDGGVAGRLRRAGDRDPARRVGALCQPSARRRRVCRHLPAGVLARHRAPGRGVMTHAARGARGPGSRTLIVVLLVGGGRRGAPARGPRALAPRADDARPT